MADYPGFGEMLSYIRALEAEQVALTWRRMPAGTGGKGSYGHRHHTQEELYLVLSGEVEAKIEGDVFTLGRGMAIRVPTGAFRSIHNDGPDEAQLVICSVRIDDPRADVDAKPNFWPDDNT